MRGTLIIGALLTCVLPVASQSILDVVRYATYLVLRPRRPCLLTMRSVVANDMGQKPSIRQRHPKYSHRFQILRRQLLRRHPNRR